MKNLHSPLNIELLLWFNTRSIPYPMQSSPAAQEGIIALVDSGIIAWEVRSTTDASTYKTTEKGRAWVAMLCELPPPIQAWVDQNQNVIKL